MYVTISWLLLINLGTKNIFLIVIIIIIITTTITIIMYH